MQLATIIQDDLRQIGMTVRVVPLEFRALHEACLLGLGGGDVDPNPGMSVWLSSGSNHLWHLGQSQPATSWEAEIDSLMRQQLVELDPVARKRQFDRVQAILAEQLPMIFLVGPNVLVGARHGLGNFVPAVLDHSTLWNVEELFWQTRPTSPERR